MGSFFFNLELFLPWHARSHPPTHARARLPAQMPHHLEVSIAARGVKRRRARVVEHDPPAVGRRVLDVGARGVMVRMVGDARPAEIIVQSGKYPPMGQRGAAFEIAHDHYAPGSVVAKINHANEEGLLIAQIENRPGLENVARSAALDGIDVLWIGGFDLSNFLGIPGQFDHPEFTAALERVVAASERHGKAAGYQVHSIEEGQLRLRQGFRCVAYGGDLWLYRRALREGIEGLSRRTY